MLLQRSNISEIEARELTAKFHLIFLDSKKSGDAPNLDANLFPAAECSPPFGGALSFDGRMTNGPPFGKVSSLEGCMSTGSPFRCVNAQRCLL